MKGLSLKKRHIIFGKKRGQGNLHFDEDLDLWGLSLSRSESGYLSLSWSEYFSESNFSF